MLTMTGGTQVSAEEEGRECGLCKHYLGMVYRYSSLAAVTSSRENNSTQLQWLDALVEDMSPKRSPTAIVQMGASP